MRHGLRSSLEVITGREATAADNDTGERVDTRPEPAATMAAETPGAAAAAGHAGHRASPGERQPERAASSSEGERRRVQHFNAQEVRYLSGRVEELERRLRRRTAALVGTVALTGFLAGAAVNLTVALFAEAEPVAVARGTAPTAEVPVAVRPEGDKIDQLLNLGAPQPAPARPTPPAVESAEPTLIEPQATAAEQDLVDRPGRLVPIASPGSVGNTGQEAAVGSVSSDPAAPLAIEPVPVNQTGDAAEERPRPSDDNLARPISNIAKFMRELHGRTTSESTERHP
jgi:hypothetical protein